MSKDNFFVPENLVENSEKIHLSQSKKYSLFISEYTTKEGCWSYSRGVVKHKNGNIIADIKRNYNHFPFHWVENHPNKHDYLICGEDYQGQTIIELDTEKRKDYLSKNAENGFGFCWVSMKASPNKQVLAVNGCVWGSPYEVLFVDFSDPLKGLPYLKNQPEDYSEFYSWNDDGTANIGHEEIRRKSDGKRSIDLTDEEEDKMYDNNDYEEVLVKTIWTV